MALWGNKDSKTASGTVAIANTGVVTGTGTAFTTEAKIGNTIRIGGIDYEIVTITSDTVAKVIMGKNNGNGTVTVAADGAYTLSEKPAFVAHESSGSASGVHGDSNKVYGVNITEGDVGGDNVVEVSVANAGSGYVEVPGVSFSGGGGSGAAATATISGGVVTAVTVSNNGSSYETVPTVTIQVPVLTLLTSGVNTTTDVITYVGHGQVTGDALAYNNGGSTSITGLTSGTTYYVSKLTNDTFKLYDTAVNATAAGATGLMDLSGTGNNAQYFIIGDGVRATATAVKGSGTTDGANSGIGNVTHAGWVRRTVGTGGRAGRVQYETLVANGTTAATSGDQADDIQFPDA
jgi:hypothetical protein